MIEQEIDIPRLLNRRHYAAVEVLLIDLYCGAGTIGLSMAKNAKKLIDVEIISQAIENAMLNDIDNSEFICADASQAATQLAERGTAHVETVVQLSKKNT